MEQYFKDVVSDLSIDDMNFLGALYDNDATAGFKAMTHNEVMGKCGLTIADFRKVVYRLVANKFISTVPNKRQHSVYLTHYGIAALRTNIEGASA
jgi:DNA-binding MarR family transcriptional regulator